MPLSISVHLPRIVSAIDYWIKARSSSPSDGNGCAQRPLEVECSAGRASATAVLLKTLPFLLFQKTHRGASDMLSFLFPSKHTSGGRGTKVGRFITTGGDGNRMAGDSRRWTGERRLLDG